MIFIIILFFSAFLLSSVAAYYSIVGLVAIFPTAVFPIILMGITLELAKLVCASWLYRNWKTAPATIKYYFTVAVVILSFITSMGIFGFLSKAHIDQTLGGADTSIELKTIEDQIASEQQRLDNAQRSLTALDRLVDQSDIEKAIRVRNLQRKERALLANEINSASTAIKTLNTQANPLRKESKRTIAEVGPIKYIADLLYGESTEGTLEKAVRAVIILLVLVFDPLAIILLIAANRELKLIEKPKPTYKKYVPKALRDKNKVIVDKSSIAEITPEIPKEIMEKVFKKKKSAFD